MQRQHDDARRPVALDTDRMQHRLVGVKPEFARDFLGGNLKEGLGHFGRPMTYARTGALSRCLDKPDFADSQSWRMGCAWQV